MPTEDDLLNKLADAKIEINAARSDVNNFKRKLIEAETVLIGAKLAEEKLIEQLRRLRNHNGTSIE